MIQSNTTPTSATPEPEMHVKPPIVSMRFIVSLVIVLIWGGMIFQLWQRESYRSGAGLADIGVSPELMLVTFTGYEHWMEIDQNNQRLGASWLSIFPEKADVAGNYILESRSRVSLKLLAAKIPLDSFSKVVMNNAFELDTLQTVLLTPGFRIQLQGFAEDRKFYFRYMIDHIEPGSDDAEILASFPGQNSLAASMLSGGLLTPQDRCGSIPLERSIILQDVLMPILTRAETLEKGMRRVTNASNPLTGKFEMPVVIEVKGQETLRVGDTEYEAWKVVERMGEVESQIWYDDQGNLLKKQWPGGIRMTRAESSTVSTQDPGFAKDPELSVVNREHIRTNLDPELENLPIEDLIAQAGLF